MRVLAPILAVVLCASPSSAQEIGNAALPDLRGVPEPLLDDFEAAVREQLNNSRVMVDRAVSEGRSDRANEALGRLCSLYLRYELLTEAEPCLREAIRVSPRDFRTLYHQVVLYERDGRLAEARARASQALEVRPRDVPSLLRGAGLSLRMGETAEAEEGYRRALEIEPASSAARFGLGRVAAERGLPEDAIRYFEEALPAQPEGSIIHHHLGMAYRESGNLERAREELSKNRQIPIVFFDPLIDELKAMGTSSEEVFERGVRARRAGRLGEAIQAFEEVLERNPTDAEAYFNLARVQIDTSDLGEAERNLRAALEQRPGYGEAHFNLGILLGRSGRREEGGEHLVRAAEADPENLSWRVVAARALADSGRFSQAITELEEVVARDPGFADGRLALGAMLSAVGEHSRAATEFEHLVALTPADVEVRFGLTISLLGSGAYPRALLALETAVDHFPGEPALWDLLARVLASCPDDQVRDGQRAVAIAQRLAQESESVQHTETLAMAFAEAGRFEEAVELQRRVVGMEDASTDATSSERAARLARYEAGKPYRSP